jgi:hypothetical protein
MVRAGDAVAGCRLPDVTVLHRVCSHVGKNGLPDHFRLADNHRVGIFFALCLEGRDMVAAENDGDSALQVTVGNFVRAIRVCGKTGYPDNVVGTAMCAARSVFVKEVDLMAIGVSAAICWRVNGGKMEK